MENNKRLVIMYDFDKTLSTKYMSEFKLIPDLNYSNNNEFWQNTTDSGVKYNMESNIAFMYATLMCAKDNGIMLTKEYLQKCGKDIVFYNGVTEWFNRINEYGKSKGLNVEHYIISSGIKDVISGSKIAKYIDNIFASNYAYDTNGEAFWPSVIVNYTTKTQYIFRIRKNSTFDVSIDDGVNDKISDDSKVVPWSNMIYIGDGFTDIPSMEIVKDKGGNSICVYDTASKSVADKIIEDDRVNYIALSDYSPGSKIDIIVKNIIDSVSNKIN